MRIAQIAPLEESVPPKLYGGTGRVVSYLTEALIEAGHQVTLFASGDSWTRAELVASWPQATRLGNSLNIEHRTIPSILMLETVLREAHRFDVIHSHIEYAALPTLSRLSVPFVSTMHNNLESPAVKQLFEAFPTAALVSCSNAQRRPLPNANWISTIYHGLPAMHLNPVQQPSLDYLAFLGRISPEKGIAQAVHIAAGAGMRLKVAAKIDPSADGPYYENEIKRMFELPHVEFIGEIGEAEKGYFLGNAKALLFPIQWEEPFGIVMVESMACGTPVIAFNRGSVVEVVEDNISGFVVEDELQAIAAIKRLDALPRAGVRRAFENRFTSSAMAQGYLNVYEELRERSGWCGVNENCF